MITKVFEVRDSMTFIPVIATSTFMPPDEEAYLIGRAGFNLYGSPFVLVTRLTDQETAASPSAWRSGTRTMPVAHEYIAKHFHELETGAVIDVEYILGERDSPKQSERLEAFGLE